MRGLIGIVYLIIGFLVAAAREYLGGIDGVNDVVSAALAILLWPLVLLGIDFEIGRGGRGGRAVLPVVAPFWSGVLLRALSSTDRKQEPVGELIDAQARPTSVVRVARPHSGSEDDRGAGSCPAL